MLYAIAILALLNSLTGWLLYDQINSFANYRASVEAQTKAIKEANQAEIAAHKAKLTALSIQLENEAKQHETELESLKTESDSALNDAIARMRKRSSRCESRVPTAISSAEADHNETGKARDTTKGMDELLAVDRLIKQYEKINADYALCLKGYNVN